MDFIFGEGAAFGRANAEQTEGLPMAANHNGYAADDAVLLKQRRRLETPVIGRVFNDDGFTRFQGKGNVAAGRNFNESFAGQTVLPSYAGAQEGVSAVR